VRKGPVEPARETEIERKKKKEREREKRGKVELPPKTNLFASENELSVVEFSWDKK